MIYNFFINFLAWFIALCIYILPIFGLVKLIKALLRKKKYKKPKIVKITSATGWTWDEERQLWVHPNSEKGTTANTEYSYKADDLVKEKPFFTKQGYTNDVPNEDWRTMNDYNYKPPVYTAPKYTPEPPKQEPNKYAEYQGAYKATPILTDNERRNFRTLKEAADRKGYSISMKVRLADLVTPKGGSDYMAKFGKIKSKHVDFVIYDEYASVKAVIELDDRTHDRQARQDRDQFVDTILRDAGYIVIHTRYITPNILDGI